MKVHILNHLLLLDATNKNQMWSNPNLIQPPYIFREHYFSTMLVVQLNQCLLGKKYIFHNFLSGVLKIAMFYDMKINVLKGL